MALGLGVQHDEIFERVKVEGIFIEVHLSIPGLDDVPVVNLIAVEQGQDVVESRARDANQKAAILGSLDQ